MLSLRIVRTQSRTGELDNLLGGSFEEFSALDKNSPYYRVCATGMILKPF